MKSYIFISGGGDISDTQELDRKYFELLRNNSKILYIPIAMEADRIGYEDCYDWFTTLISTHNQGKEIDFTMLLENDHISDLIKYDAVYIGGGNTFTLLNYLVKNNLHQGLTEYINSGGIVYGGSAGAIVFGKDIRTVEEENNKNYVNYIGMNVLNNCSIICHYEESLDKKIYEAIKKIQTPVIALPENAGLIIGNNTVNIIGKGFIFKEETKEFLTSDYVSKLK